MSLRLLISVGVLTELAYLSFFLMDESPSEVLLFIGVNAFAFALLAAVLVKYRSVNNHNPTTKLHTRNLQANFCNPRSIILGFAILFRLTLVFHPPVASDDLYRYIWDGKVAAHGVNPFRYAPSDSMLMELHTKELPAKVNHPAMRTIYPPLAQILFFISNRLFGDSLSGVKLLLVCADIVSLLLLVRLCKGMSDPDRSLLLYSWSPLPIMYFGLDGHIDALAIPFLLLFLYQMGRHRYFAAAVSLGFAGLAKLYPLFLAPLLLWFSRGWKRLVWPLVPVVLLVVGGWFYWEPTGGLVESFKVFSSEFEFNGSVFHLVYEFVKTNTMAHLVCSILFLMWLGTVFLLNRSLVEKTFLSFLGFIILAPVVQPWYLTWLAILLTLRWSTATFVLLGLSNLSNIVAYQYRLMGTWDDNTLILLVEYLPFYCLLVWEVARGNFGALNQHRANVFGKL